MPTPSQTDARHRSTVRITATDGAGNSRTTTRTVQVVDVPGPRT